MTRLPPSPTEDQVDSEQLSPRAEKAEEGSGEGLLDDQMEPSDANADAATGSVSLVEEGAPEVATSGLECAERSALEPHDDELTPGDVPRESAQDREEPAEAEGVQVDVSSDDASASTLPEGLEELALFGDAESSGLELTPEESAPEASHEDDVSEADPTTDHMEQPPRTPTLESLDALSASLSESPSSSALMGSEGAAAREEERLRLKDLRQEFSVVAELEATRQKRALFAVLIALGLGALVALFIFIDANTERPDVKAEFSGIKTAPGIHA